MKKAIFSIIIVLVITILGGLSYLYIAFPAVKPAPDISVKGTPAQIERGKYLAEHVTVCIDCHSNRDWSKFSGPIKSGTYGRGGDIFNEKMGMPGTFYAQNITPHNLGNWTDGEIYRTITTGVTKEGKPMFPVMPYPAYAKMDPDDVKAIIAYLRTLEPITYNAPSSEPNFPMNLIMRTIPQEAQPMERPPKSDPVKYGKYLTLIGGCAECHTPQKQGADIEGMYLAGGFEFGMPNGTVRSANITPHQKYGIGRWSKNEFVERFKQYDVPTDSLSSVSGNQFNTIMPWKMYAGMTDEDLEAIYEYLQTVEPVDNSVNRFTPKTETTAKK
ncbi:c-type cytochrome [Fodinibius halophilus]|uniref:Cytochrome c n=1 Tax=Fodinibius halophilus TaxID=1736908 RepID=A0A6M1TJR2_9BACT|nr:cytochrome c [Fodinibius halophilus]NGP88840.1 cytochrome c [Fodinibius halophilus]